LTVALRPRDPAGLAAYAAAVSTPSDPLYHQYLTVSQFAARFGPTAASVAAVRAALRAQGLSPGALSANGLALPVSTTAGAASRALHTPLNRVRLPGGRVALANSAAPRLAATAAAAVQSVVGLDTLSQPRPLGLTPQALAPADRSHVVTGGPQPCATIAPFQYTADELASAYRFSPLYGAGDLGAGTTIGLYELEPNSTSDVATYQSCYGTSTTVDYTEVDGGSGTGAGSGEAALDIEDVIGLAPKATVRVYQAPNNGGSGPFDLWNSIVSADAAKVVSTSWGSCEAADSSVAASEATLFQEAATQGQSILAASGDNGSEACYQQTLSTALAVNDPASQPDVTGVGGTSLNAAGPPPSQTVWNAGSAVGGAGGGGISALWGMPAYQSGAPAGLHVVNTNSSGQPCQAVSGDCREVPDVSADADPATGYVIYYGGHWLSFGGTSAAAPLWAAFIALTNSSASCGGTPVGFLNPALYQVAGSGYSANFSDVTSGNNDWSGTNGHLYPAGTGYDMASGLGTPVGSTLAASLCSDGAHIITVTNPGSQSSAPNVATSLQIQASDSAPGQTLTYGATGLPAGLTIAPGTGLISGTPTTTGISSVTVTVQDGAHATGSTTFSWAITANTVTVTNPGNQSSTQDRAASLQVHAVDSATGQTLTYGAAGLPNGLSIGAATGLISGSPTNPGTTTVTLTVSDATGAVGHASFTWHVAALPHGYWLVGSDGGIFTFGQAAFHGSTGNLQLQRPVVGMTPTADHQGYWMVATDGGMFAFGDANYYGSLPGLGYNPAGSGLPKALNAPIVAMVASPDGRGYLLVAQDGGVFAFGDAQYHGSCPGIGGCSGAVVAVVPDTGEAGYWAVTQTGHVYPFGNAAHLGQPAGTLFAPVTGAVASATGHGYLITDIAGDVYAYGDAHVLGGPPFLTPGDGVVGVVADDTGAGYWLASAQGHMFQYGDAPADGSMAGHHLNGPIVTAAGF
jgi:kumamolisin